MKILVTGGAGYIGSILVPELLNRGYKVTVLDNFLYRQNSLAQLCSHQSFDIIWGDVRNYELMSKVVPQFDVIIPLAALVGAPLCARDPVAASSTNRDANLNLFKLISRNQLVLMPTTNSSYGTSENNKPCTEESPLKPISLYASDKVIVEKALMEHENVISFRLATVFGMSPRMRIDLLVNDFTYRAVYDRFLVLFEAHFNRNYVHVRDVTRVFLHGLDNFSKMKGQIFNVGLSDANFSKWQLCEVIKRHIPDFTFFKAEVGSDPDQRNYIVSNEKLEKTGFKPHFSIDDGVQELIKGYTMIKNTRFSNI